MTTRLQSPGRRKTYTISWTELPHWRQDNHYIHANYRPTSSSYADSFKSWFYLHNEFFNIHSHLSAAFVFLFLAGYLFCSRPASLEVLPNNATTTTTSVVETSSSSADVLAFSFFFVGTILCLGISAGYHTVCNHSPRVNQWGNQLDYVGIVALITGSFIPSVYYGFYCMPHLQQIYWTMISSLGVGCTTVSINPKFRSPVWRPFRAAMFTAMGLSAVFPVMHGLRMHGVEQMNRQIGLSWVVTQGCLYILGAAIYAARVPERWQPGRFDIWGSSHQIFHVLVVLAAAAHLTGLIKAYRYSHGAGRCF